MGNDWCLPYYVPTRNLPEIDKEKSSENNAYRIIVQLETRKYIRVCGTPAETLGEVNSRIRKELPAEFKNQDIEKSDASIWQDSFNRT